LSAPRRCSATTSPGRATPARSCTCLTTSPATSPAPRSPSKSQTPSAPGACRPAESARGQQPASAARRGCCLASSDWPTARPGTTPLQASAGPAQPTATVATCSAAWPALLATSCRPGCVRTFALSVSSRLRPGISKQSIGTRKSCFPGTGKTILSLSFTLIKVTLNCAPKNGSLPFAGVVIKVIFCLQPLA
jgi:hypothetical protein